MHLTEPPSMASAVRIPRRISVAEKQEAEKASMGETEAEGEAAAEDWW